MKKPTTMLLEANFDVNQTGETLEWKFSRRDGDGNPVKGKYAGEIYFTVNETMHVRIQAGSYTPFDSFQVLDCVLVTRPQITSVSPGVAPVFAPPSPFVDANKVPLAGATVALSPGDFKPSKVVDPEPGYFQIAQQWDQHLKVGECTGRWEFSFVLTVLIGCGAKAIRRVFVFDPEGEVGAGVTPTAWQLNEGDMVALECTVDPEGEIGAGVTPT